jgi:acyl dehydratase
MDQLEPITMKVDRPAILAYAGITGDFNPIHVDPEFAAKTSMGGIIAHGTLSLNLIWQSLAASFGTDALRGASLDIRFSRPVRDGDTVQAGGRLSEVEPGLYDVWVRNQHEVSVIEGTARLKPA